MRSTFKFTFLIVSCCVGTAGGANVFAQAPAAPPAVMQDQTPSPPEKPKAPKSIRRSAPRQTRVTMVKDQEPVAPQVVTIVHRLNGVKLLRYLLRESGEPGTVATIDPEAVSNDAHASIIAGLALDDGKTILARLPQVAAEMEVERFTYAFPGKTGKSDKPDKTDDQADKTDRDEPPTPPGATTVFRRTPRPPRMQPDLTVMTQEGRTFRARYVGIDGLTGLSVLQLAEPVTASSETIAKKIAEGETVQVFAPQQVASDVPYQILVRIGKIDAKVAKLASTKAVVERATLRGARLSPSVIGGVACDHSGNILGIVDAIEGTNARLLTSGAVRDAARRVLERQTSVPRPLLGIRGEEVDLTAKKTLLDLGWNEQELRSLIEKEVGIVLTSVLPGTPAALANLHPGDIIVRVNDKEVKGAEEFSQLLARAGSGEEVLFTVERPRVKAPLTMEVTLGGAFQPNFEWKFAMPEMPKLPSGGLKNLGVECVALSPKSATQWGGAGVLVVSVEPDSAASRAGLREGDVIETIDGRAVGRGTWTYVFPFNKKEKHVLSVVREREKKQVVIEPVE